MIVFTDWRKSSRSGNGPQCVEIGFAPGHIGVRDSKLGNTSPVLDFGVRDWQLFATEIKSGKYDFG